MQAGNAAQPGRRASPGWGSGAKAKGALYRETLQTTGFYMGRIVIVPREFAPIPCPPLRHYHFRANDRFPEGVFGGMRNLSVRWSGNHPDLRPECRLPLVGPRTPVKERDGRSAPCSSSAMSSDRLFLDRVARQHCPSPLHRHWQINMHSSDAQAKGDISTLHKKGTFLFCVDSDCGDSVRSESTGAEDPSS
jgi:hypothetical protein